MLKSSVLSWGCRFLQCCCQPSKLLLERRLLLFFQYTLQWHGHVSRSLGLIKTILQGTVKGERTQGRQRKRWEDNIRERTGLEFAMSQRAVENRGKWRKLVVKSSVVPQRWWWWRKWWWWYSSSLDCEVLCSMFEHQQGEDKILTSVIKYFYYFIEYGTMIWFSSHYNRLYVWPWIKLSCLIHICVGECDGGYSRHKGAWDRVGGGLGGHLFFESLPLPEVT